MGIRSRLAGAWRGFRAGATGQTWDPDDDRWYRDDPSGELTYAGYDVTPDRALTVTGILASVRLISNLIGTMSLKVYRRLEGGAKEEARRNPLWKLLHERPNSWQTSSEYVQFMVMQWLLHGNALAEKLVASNGTIGELHPIPWSHVQIDRVKRTKLVVFDIDSNWDGRARTLNVMDTAHHFRGITLDSWKGLSPIALAREGVAFAKVLEIHGNRFFGAGARVGGIMTVPRMSPDAKERAREELQAEHGGVYRSHRTLFLEGEWKYQQLGMSNEDSQYLESRRWSVTDIGRIYGVPPHLLMETDKSTSWGTGIEQQSLGFVKYTLAPIAAMFEAAMIRDLVIRPAQFFVEFNFDSLLRGDAKTRWETYQLAVQNGLMNPNEIRARENLNPRDGGNKYMHPANMTVEGEEPRSTIVPPNGQNASVNVSGRA